MPRRIDGGGCNGSVANTPSDSTKKMMYVVRGWRTIGDVYYLERSVLLRSTFPSLTTTTTTTTTTMGDFRV